MLPMLAAALLLLGWAPMLARLRAQRSTKAPALDRILLLATWTLCMALTASSVWQVAHAAPGAGRRIVAGLMMQWSGMALWRWARENMGDCFTQIGPAPPMLVQRGLYRRLRHPMYLATVTAALGLAVAGGGRSGYVLWALLGAVLTVRALREECLLRQYFAREWEAYARRSIGLLRRRGGSMT